MVEKHRKYLIAPAMHQYEYNIPWMLCTHTVLYDVAQDPINCIDRYHDTLKCTHGIE